MPRIRFRGNGEGAEEKGLRQRFEERDYVFPDAGAELVLPDNICSWLSYKHPDKFDILPVEKGTPEAKAGEVVGVVPAPAKPDEDENVGQPEPTDTAPRRSRR